MKYFAIAFVILGFMASIGIATGHTQHIATLMVCLAATGISIMAHKKDKQDGTARDSQR